MELRSTPRWPAVAEGQGHYESFYIKACHPDGGLGVWIRETVHKRPGGRAIGSTWFALFDASADGPIASKLSTADLDSQAGRYIRVGDSRIEPGRAIGSAPSDRADPVWDLRFTSAEPVFRHLPADWMYERPLPRTKALTPYPAASFEGVVEVGGRTIELSGWPGMVGHNWGSQHAERWIWLHGDGPGWWIDAAIGRIRLFGATLPWVGNGRLAIGEERFTLGGLSLRRSLSVRERPDGCELELPGAGVTVRGSVAAPRKDFVAWRYADPTGEEHHAVNCSIATLELAVERAGGPVTKLTCAGRAAYELGMREHDHGIEVQPFSDP